MVRFCSKLINLGFDSYVSAYFSVVLFLPLCVCFCPHLGLVFVSLTLALYLGLILSDWINAILLDDTLPIRLLFMDRCCI